MYTESSNLSDILRQLRQESGMSLREFSETIGISHAYLNKLEKGEDSRTGKPITPTIETLVKISEGLGIPTKKFMNMCGYFGRSMSAQEPYPNESINIDNEISLIIAQISSNMPVTVGETLIDEAAKELLLDDLRKILINILNKYDTKEQNEST